MFTVLIHRYTVFLSTSIVNKDLLRSIKFDAQATLFEISVKSDTQAISFEIQNHEIKSVKLSRVGSKLQ